MNNSPAAPHRAKANLYFFTMTALCQAIGVGTVTLASEFFVMITKQAFPSSNSQLYLLLAIHSFAAFSAARIIKLPLIWQLFNLFIAPAIIVYPTLGLPHGVLLIVVTLSVMLYLPTLWTRVPYYPTSRPAYAEVLRFLPPAKPVRFLDIGSGFGTLLIYLARERPEAKIYGAEISPLPFLYSRAKTFFSGRSNLTVLPKNFWKLNFADYDVIYAFLSPTPMEELWRKVRSEMKPGSVFISNTFPTPAAATDEITLNDARKSTLYIYKIR